MRKQTFILMALCATALAGCLENDIERGAAGALGGAVISEVTGGSALTGAVIGGAAGVLCDDLNVAGCR